MHRLTKEEARRIAVRAQLLDAPRVATPRHGRLGGIVTTSAGRWDLGVPRTIGVGEGRATRTTRVRIRLRLSPAGRRIVRRPGRQRARIVVYHLSRSGVKVTMRQIRL